MLLIKFSFYSIFYLEIYCCVKTHAQNWSSLPVLAWCLPNLFYQICQWNQNLKKYPAKRCGSSKEMREAFLVCLLVSLLILNNCFMLGFRKEAIDKIERQISGKFVCSNRSNFFPTIFTSQFEWLLKNIDTSNLFPSCKSLIWVTINLSLYGIYSIRH